MLNKSSSVLLALFIMFFLSSCSSLKTSMQSVEYNSITGYYQSGVSEGEVKKVILYLKESYVLKEDEPFEFTLEKHPDEYRVIVDVHEADKFDLSSNSVFGLFDSEASKHNEDKLQKLLLRTLAIGLTEEVLNEYTEIRIKDVEQKLYHIFPPSYE